MHVIVINIYRPQRSWGKVIFSQVCVKNSVHMEGGCPPGSRHPPEQCMLGDTGNRRAVRILLECILVYLINNNSKTSSVCFTWIFIIFTEKQTSLYLFT